MIDPLGYAQVFPEPRVQPVSAWQQSVETRTRDLESAFQVWPSRAVGCGTPLRQYFIRQTLSGARLCIRGWGEAGGVPSLA